MPSAVVGSIPARSRSLRRVGTLGRGFGKTGASPAAFERRTRCGCHWVPVGAASSFQGNGSPDADPRRYTTFMRDVPSSRLPAPAIPLPKEAVSEFCRRHRIRKLSLFGSVLRTDFSPESDVDVLVEFEPGVRYGFAFFALERELSEILGREVDLHTPEDLSRHFRAEIMETAEPVYAAAG